MITYRLIFYISKVLFFRFIVRKSKILRRCRLIENAAGKMSGTPPLLPRDKDRTRIVPGLIQFKSHDQSLNPIVQTHISHTRNGNYFRQ